MPYGLIALAAALGAALCWLHARERARIRRLRGGFFDRCRDLFDSCRITQDGIDMAVLEGRYRGHRFRVEPIIDHINLRKVPPLWLLVTLRGDLPWRGTLDLLVRPQNTEFYSPAAGLPTGLDLPAGWPAHAALRTDRPEAAPPVGLVGRHIGFFDDPRAKELLVTPRGVRLVYQADQARRAHYLVLRQAEFETLTLDPALLRGLMDRALALHEELRRDGHEQAPADAKAA